MLHARPLLAAIAALIAAALAPSAAAQTITRLPPPPDAAPAVDFEPPAPLLLAPQAEAAAPPASPAPNVAPESEIIAAPPPDSPLEAAELVDEATAERWHIPSHWFGSPELDVGFELGLNGSSGASDALSTRVGGYVKRETKAVKLDASLYHNRTKTNGAQTQNNAMLEVRHDWKRNDSPSSLFVMTQTFYDEFQAFDVNMNLTSGLGYKVVDADFLKFNTRLGAGASREFGGTKNEWVPEAQVGLNWEQPIYDAHKFTAKMDYFPEWGDFNRYRLVTDIGWTVALSQPSNVSLKFSLSDRFDSHPDGVNPHITNYSVLLLWKH